MTSPSGIASSWCSCAYDVLAVAAMSSATTIRRLDKAILTFVQMYAAFPALKRNLLDSFPRKFPWRNNLGASTFGINPADFIRGFSD
jgi:hypothetical protein